MGVRGLTSYIARNADRYLQPYELHDCNLVIDGDNLACNLYKDVSGCNSAFGGDYDAYYRTVINFFQLLKECHVRAFVLMDGGYEKKKMRTIEQRLRSKIGMIKHLNPLQSKPLFPLMMREVFVDAAQDSAVQVMRCILEADDELAVMSRKLNCPVLSYDSDFYIHDVKYIPLVTLTLKVHTKNTKDQTVVRKLRRCEAKNIAKRDALQAQEEDAKSTVKKSKPKTVKYLDCCIYTIENLAGKSLNTEMLPIFAALLGNDYIERRAFKKFYAGLGFRGRNNKVCKQQKRIRTILRWLRYETKESAIEKILQRMPKEYRERLLVQLQSATSGYSCETSEAFEFFGLDEADVESDEEIEGGHEEVTDESDDDELEEGSEAAASDLSSSDAEDEHPEDEDVAENDSSEELATEPEDSSTQYEIPEWLKARIYAAELPRYFADLVHLRMYINNPQVENFLFEDCNEIALKILQYIFTILNSPEQPQLRYLTRVVRLTNVHYKTLQPLELQSTYDPDLVDMDGFKAIFHDMPDSQKLFEDIDRIPSHFQLYFLAIAYWAHFTKRASHIHLHTLLICFIVLSVIDAKVEPIRDLQRFQKKFNKIMTKTRSAKALAMAEDEPKAAVHRTTADKIKFIPKTECIVVMETMLKYFRLDESLKKRHNDFSSTILHGFSEFQAVFYHLSALNALFNYPFEAVRISQCFNGMFLYNMFANLRTRVDIEYYVLHFLFHESNAMSEFYGFLVDWCGEVFEKLEKNETCKSSGRRAAKKKKIPLTEIVEKVNGCRVEDMLEGEVSDGSEFDDVNNKFSMLLKVR